jgi:AAT family amino acid transporter
MIFTTRGRSFVLKVYQIPAGGRSSRGKALVNLVQLEDGEKVAALLPLVPTGALTTEVSPLVAALAAWRLAWAGNAMNIVLVSAILATMLAAMFGLGRMMRSLAAEGHAPAWLRDGSDIPYRGILFSGAAMLAGLALGQVLPEQVYLFLVSAGGFSLLLAYAVILATHYKFRRTRGCPPQGNCQLPGFPYTSWLAMGGCVAIIASMPLVPGQGAGLAAGLALLAVFAAAYQAKKRLGARAAAPAAGGRELLLRMQLELAEDFNLGRRDGEADGEKENGPRE